MVTKKQYDELKGMFKVANANLWSANKNRFMFVGTDKESDALAEYAEARGSYYQLCDVIRLILGERVLNTFIAEFN